jgi:hypothetical protein
MVDRSDDASCLLGLAVLPVERVVLAPFGVRIVPLATDDPGRRALPGVPDAVEVREGPGTDPPARPAGWR